MPDESSILSTSTISEGDMIYSIERHERGWLVCSSPDKDGVPISAFAETLKLFGKTHITDPGIARHYLVTGKLKAVFAVCKKRDSKAWREDIKTDLSVSGMDRETQWWLGTDVGKSSASMFGVFSGTGSVRDAARDFSGGATPRDCDDLSRCLNLLFLFPEWEGRLTEVASAYPDAGWPAIISRWDDLKSSCGKRRNEILDEINKQADTFSIHKKGET